MLSRVADSLYWMSRYLERAEHTARLLDVHVNLALEQPDKAVERLRQLSDCLHTPCTDDSFSFVHQLTFDLSTDASIVASIGAARENARQVRERISSEMWQELNRLYLHVKSADSGTAFEIEPHVFFQDVKSGAHMFQGITDSTISHGEGWHFIQLGRFIERALSVAALLDARFKEMSYQELLGTGDYFDWLGLLKCCTAFEAYSKVYTADLRPAQVAEFLLLNEEFPHSVRFSADRIQDALNAVADATETRKFSRVHRLAGKLRAMLSYNQIDEIMSGSLHHYLMDVQKQCSDIHTAVHETYVAYPITSALA